LIVKHQVELNEREKKQHKKRSLTHKRQELIFQNEPG